MVPVLDLGNVVIQVDWVPFCTYLQHETGVEQHERLIRFLKSSLFYEYEFGNISSAEFLQRMRVMYGADFKEDAFFEAFCSIFPGWVPQMDKVLEELSQTASGVYCLSNTNEVHLSFVERHFPGVRNFKKVFASHQMKRRKPYPGIYRQVARELQLSPKEIMFFDDIEANVRGARRAGLEAYLFKEADDFTSRFMKLQERKEA